MSERCKVKQGDSILEISKKYGVSPEAIWNDPANTELKNKRKSEDVLYPNDELSVPERQTKEDSIATDQSHKFRVIKSLGLVIRLDIDPIDASSHDDRFVLSSDDGSYSKEKTIINDLVPGDTYVDLYYSGLKEQLSYTLKVHVSEESVPTTVFEDVPYEELVNVSAEENYGDEEEVGELGEDDSPYPQEPDAENEQNV